MTHDVITAWRKALLNHAELPDQSRTNTGQLTEIGSELVESMGEGWVECFRAVATGQLAGPFGPCRDMTLEDTMRLQPIIHLVGLCHQGGMEFWAELLHQPGDFRNSYLPCSSEDEFAMILKVEEEQERA